MFRINNLLFKHSPRKSRANKGLIMIGIILLLPLGLLFLSWYVSRVNKINDRMMGRPEQETKLLDGNPLRAINDIQDETLLTLNKITEDIVNDFVDMYATFKKTMPRDDHHTLLQKVSKHIFKTPENIPNVIQNEFGICYMWALSEGLKKWDNQRVLQSFAMIDKHLIKRGFQRQPESIRHSIIKSIGVPPQHIMTADDYFI